MFSFFSLPEGTNPRHITTYTAQLGSSAWPELVAPCPLAGKNTGSQQHVPDKAENPAEKAAW